MSKADQYGDRPALPAVMPPRTPETIAKLAKRARHGQQLFPTGDVRDTLDTGLHAEQNSNSSQTILGLAVRPGADAPLAGFGARLRRIRVGRKLGIRQLARLSGLSNGSISHLESGRSLPKLETVYALAEALKLSLDKLLGRNPPVSG